MWHTVVIHLNELIQDVLIQPLVHSHSLGLLGYLQYLLFNSNVFDLIACPIDILVMYLIVLSGSIITDFNNQSYEQQDEEDCFSTMYTESEHLVVQSLTGHLLCKLSVSYTFDCIVCGLFF